MLSDSDDFRKHKPDRPLHFRVSPGHEPNQATVRQSKVQVFVRQNRLICQNISPWESWQEEVENLWWQLGDELTVQWGTRWVTPYVSLCPSFHDSTAKETEFLTLPKPTDSSEQTHIWALVALQSSHRRGPVALNEKSPQDHAHTFQEILDVISM